ncbi:MAG TPA: matrixin family metalloprotease [Fimbriimonadaceae bacterium]|nr:matrixin family metalloprotease [Fimbriimonadaceae bacterium]
MRLRLPLFLAFCVVFATGADAPSRPLVLPELFVHLKHAEDDLERGQAGKARAHAELVLLARPIRVHVDTGDPRLRELAEQAMRHWEAHVGALRFDLVDAREAHDVHIRFQPGLSRNGSNLAGHVKWRRVVRPAGGLFEWSIEAHITLRTRRPDGRPMLDDAIVQAAMHELGHVLGLADCEGYEHVMSPLLLDRPCTTPSHSELTALRDLRGRAKDVITRIELLTAYNRQSAAD